MRTEPSNQKSLEVDGQKKTLGSLEPKSMKSNWLNFLFNANVIGINLH